MTGAQVRQALARQLARGWGGIPSVSGVRVRVACDGPHPDLEIVWPSGTPVAATETLVVAATDFFAARATRDAAVTRREASLAMAPLVRDAVANWLSARGGRLRAADLTTPPRWEVPDDGTCLAGAVSRPEFGVRVGATPVKGHKILGLRALVCCKIIGSSRCCSCVNRKAPCQPFFAKTDWQLALPPTGERQSTLLPSATFTSSGNARMLVRRPREGVITCRMPPSTKTARNRRAVALGIPAALTKRVPANTGCAKIQSNAWIEYRDRVSSAT